MPTKRAILAELTGDELRTKLDHYELEVKDRRVNAQLVDALGLPSMNPAATAAGVNEIRAWWPIPGGGGMARDPIGGSI